MSLSIATNLNWRLAGNSLLWEHWWLHSGYTPPNEKGLAMMQALD
jgi:hypothetical protein